MSNSDSDTSYQPNQLEIEYLKNLIKNEYIYYRIFLLSYYLLSVFLFFIILNKRNNILIILLIPIILLGLFFKHNYNQKIISKLNEYEFIKIKITKKWNEKTDNSTRYYINGKRRKINFVKIEVDRDIFKTKTHNVVLVMKNNKIMYVI